MSNLRIFLCSIILFFPLHLLFGQAETAKVIGTVIDSTAAPMIAATVVLLQHEDSVLVTYALTNGNGEFVMNKVSPGKYFLQITYIGYGNYQQVIEVPAGQAIRNLGTLFLSPKNSLLKEVVVRSEHIPIAFSNDTIIYNADAFKTRPNAAVEDLLRKLPGVEVGRDGSIKAQGEDVQNILVDGKEFFGQDPTIATQNLPADVVDKVQVFDKKSDMAEFSGIDDGDDEKTINLSLKEDKKNGYFGQVEGSGGHDDPGLDFAEARYQGKASVHRFNPKLQLSLLAMANNNNDQGFSFNDYLSFMGGMGNFMRGGSIGLTGNGAAGIPIGRSGLSGITETQAGGLNFNLAINEKIDWQSSYFLNRIDNWTVQQSRSQDFTGSETFSRIDSSTRQNLNLNQRFNSTLRVSFDSTTEMTWRNNLSWNNGDVNSWLFAQTLGNAGQLENETQNLYSDDGEQWNWNSTLSFRKRLGKPGRIISANLSVQSVDDQLNIAIQNQTTFFQNDSIPSAIAIYQDQPSRRNEWQYDGLIRYVEPFGKSTFLSVEGGLGNIDNERVYEYFDIDPIEPSKRILNTELSNAFQSDWQFRALGTSLRHNTLKVKLSGGLRYQSSQLISRNISEEQDLDRSFAYLLPNLRMDVDLESAGNLEFIYNTRIQEPALEQLQPNVNNANPLYEYVGNPALMPEYRHLANVHYMLFDEFSFTSLFANLQSTYTLNKIANQSTINDNLKQTVQPINTDYEWNTNLYLAFSTPIRRLKSKISLETTTGFNRGTFFINGQENLADRWTSNMTLTLENRKKDKVDVVIGGTLGLSDIHYDNNPQFDQNYFDQRYFIDFTWFLPKGWQFESTLDYTIYSDEDFGAMDDLYLWNIEISKGFMEGERATIFVSVFDALNQNQGINRENRLNYVQETRSNVLGRHLMIGFKYRLSGFNGRGGIEVEEFGR